MIYQCECCQEYFNTNNSRQSLCKSCKESVRTIYSDNVIDTLEVHELDYDEFKKFED